MWNLLIPLAAALVLFFAAPPSIAYAENRCRIPEAGRWYNPRAATQQVRRIEIESHCSGGQVVSRMRVFTRCSPRDCKWGWTEATRLTNGRLLARFPGLFGAREIEIIRMEDRIEALVKVQSHTPGTPDAFHAAILDRE